MKKSVLLVLLSGLLQCMNEPPLITETQLLWFRAHYQSDITVKQLLEKESIRLPRSDEDRIGQDLTEIPSGVFRNLTNLTSLDIRLANLTDLPQDIFDPLVNLENLYFLTPQLQRFPAKTFKNLIYLKNLEIRLTNLTHLPQGIFDPLINLENLYFLTPQLQSLPAKIFKNLTNLKELLFYDENLDALPQNIFQDMVKLEYVNINAHRLKFFSKEMERLRMLNTLGLYFRLPFILLSRDLGQFSRIKHLRLFGQRLYSLRANLFNALTELETLWVHHSRITSIPENVFDQLSNLKKLAIFNNDRLDVLPDDVFNPLRKLEWLSLARNNISSLNPQIFAELNLTKLISIRGNGITDLPNGIFSSFPDLPCIILGEGFEYSAQNLEDWGLNSLGEDFDRNQRFDPSCADKHPN